MTKERANVIKCVYTYPTLYVVVIHQISADLIQLILGVCCNFRFVAIDNEKQI